MSRRVVFGTGQIGRLVAEQLVADGHNVDVVNRSGSSAVDGARCFAGDATDPTFTNRVAVGADVVYFCLNATNYARWAEEFPPLQQGVLRAAENTGARLVVLDNLYAYGPQAGADLVETRPANPSSQKAATRAAMTRQLLKAHSAGRVEVVIARASDFFGPGVRQSALGDTVFTRALAGRSVQIMGDPDTLHSYSYAPDVAAGLIALGDSADAAGSVWHLPVAPAWTTREIVHAVYRMTGHRPRITAAGPTTLRLVGVVAPSMREYLHTLYQFTDRWVVDDAKFRTALHRGATPLDEALASTLAWYRVNAHPRTPTTATR